MLVEHPLGGAPQKDLGDVNDTHYSTTTDHNALSARGFLKEHPTAKIVFIVDTHCVESGYFIYEGDTPATYRACSLYEVSPTYIRLSLHIPTLYRS